MIQILLNDLPITLRDLKSDVTVLEWLRQRAQKTGTKEGCASGDCGACTVVVGSLRHRSGRAALFNDSEEQLYVEYQAINACITFLASLHAKQLITVEDLANQEQLHPVQEALFECHGSQCGFCTPGFVMSLFALYHQKGKGFDGLNETEQGHQIDRFLGGNLCRCTGYVPIKAAARRVLSSTQKDQFDECETQSISTLLSMLSKPPMHPSFLVPHSLQELADMRISYPYARLLAGGTDLALEVTQKLEPIDTIIHVMGVPQLQEVNLSETGITLGAGVSLTRCLAALQHVLPGSEQLLLRFASEQVRNQGTIGGNIANASPIADLPPLLLALDASLHLQCGRESREVLVRDFYLDYKKTQLKENEFLRAVYIPLPPVQAKTLYYKVSKRLDDDISAVCGVFHVVLQNNVVSTARLAFGGMAAIPKRATLAEQALQGQVFNQAAIVAAQASLQADFTPLSDVRASAAYRRRLAENLLQRCFLEITQPDVLTQVGDYVGD